MSKTSSEKFVLNQPVYCQGESSRLYRIMELTDTSAYLITTEDDGVDGGWKSLHQLMTEEEYKKFFED